MAAVEDSLVVNGIPYPPKRQEFLVRSLLEQLKARELRGFTVRRGMTEQETAFLVSQLASDDPVERDPEAWEALLDETGIENVDFGDRVYVPAEGVANASPIDLTDVERQRSGVIRVASTADVENLAQQTSASEPADESAEPASEGDRPPTLSSDDLRALLNRLEADASIDAEIQTLVPMVADLLKKLLESADDKAKVEHS